MIYPLSKDLSIVCTTRSNRSGFIHEAVLHPGSLYNPKRRNTIIEHGSALHMKVLCCPCYGILQTIVEEITKYTKNTTIK